MSHVHVVPTGGEPEDGHSHDSDDGHVLLDSAAWAELCTLIPNLAVPEDFAASWDGVPDADALRGPARARLETACLVDAEGHPHPGLTDLLDLLAAAPIRIRLRSGVGDRVLLAHLAVGWDTTVSLTRAQRVVRADSPHAPTAASPQWAVQDGAVVDIAAFATADLADRLWHLLPPALTQRATDATAATELAFEDAVALLHALREAPAWPVVVRRDVLADLLAQAGLDALPDVLPALAPDLAGAVEITAVLLPGTPAQRQWQGLWLLAGDGRVVAVADPHSRPADAPPARIRLVDVDAATVRADILRSLAGVLDALAATLVDGTVGG